jgi:hypothetical protein
VNTVTKRRLEPVRLTLVAVLLALLAACATLGLLGIQDPAGRLWEAVGQSAWLFVLSVLLFLIPGAAAVAWLLPEGDWIERIVLACGLSLALNALLVYATIAGLSLGLGMVMVYVALCAGLAGVKWGPELQRTLARQGAWRKIGQALKRDPAPLVLLGVMALVWATRLWVARGLEAPLWGDSYQHTMIVQLLVDHGGLFQSWAPYAPVATFTYHFGFHANIALLHWLSGDSVLQAVIWGGQVLNFIAVLALYPLACKVSGGRRWAGVGAVLAVGLLMRMPSYYVNWGRYTQLAGQAILAAAMWLAWRLVETPAWNWRLVALNTIAVLGLGVTHYRLVLIYGVFVLVLGGVVLARRWGEWRDILRIVLHLALVGGLVLVLFLPWAVNLARAYIPLIGRDMIEHGNEDEFHSGEYNALGPISYFVPHWSLVLGAVGLIWQAFRRRFGGWMVALWMGGMLLLANPYLVHLPGTGLVNNFAVFIMFYFPVGLLVGAFWGEVSAALLSRWPRAGVIALCVVAALAAGWGVSQRIRDRDPYYELIGHADLEAMAWIRENTPADARFAINGILAYGGSGAAGADGGWWIPLLTQRANTIPPLLYTMEVTNDPQYAIQVREDVRYLQQVPASSPEGVRFLQSRGVTHVYIGQGQGKVGNSGEPLLDASALAASPAYRTVYHRDQVWIFELVPPGGW